MTTIHAILYDDGTIGPLCKEPECAAQSIPVFEGRKVVAVLSGELIPDPVTGMRYKLERKAPVADSFVTFENGHMKLDVNAFLRSPEGRAQLAEVGAASERFTAPDQAHSERIIVAMAETIADVMEALGLDPDDDPECILDMVEELKAKASPAHTSEARGACKAKYLPAGSMILGDQDYETTKPCFEVVHRGFRYYMSPTSKQSIARLNEQDAAMRQEAE